MINRNLLARTIALVLVACASPIAAWADLSENTVLQTGSALNLDTGAVASSGGDLLWNGSTIAPQGSATVYNSASLGRPNFNGLGQSYWTTLPRRVNVDAHRRQSAGGGRCLRCEHQQREGRQSPGRSRTVTASITLQFTTFGAAASTGPAVSQILNNSSGTPPGMPNYGIAPSSLFVVKGSNLADPGTPTLQNSLQRSAPHLERSQHHGRRERRHHASRALLHQPHSARRRSARGHSRRNRDPHRELQRREQRSCSHPGGGQRHRDQ